MPKASIIIPAYNAASFIGATLESVLAQTFTDFECLVVDDGSTDDTVNVVKNFNDPRIRLFQQRNSGGPAKPRNVGLKHSSGEYIFIFDSDDIMVPYKLSRSIHALDAHPNADMLFSNFSSVDEKGNILKHDYLADYDGFWQLIGHRIPEAQVHFFRAEEIHAALIRTNFIGTSSVVLRASEIGDELRFDEGLSNADDYLFWVKFLESHNAVYLNSSLHSYRIQPSSISNRSYSKRGPSRINVILQIQETCEDKKLMGVLSEKLAKEYRSMAYAYKKEGNLSGQRHYSFRSLRQKFSFGAIKLLIQSLWPIN